MITIHDRPEYQEFYHGSCSQAFLSHFLLPPNETNIISEKGRNKNLDKIFFTKDLGLAKIYAGRAARSIGGEPKLYRVICPSNMICMNDTKGASVYYADHAFIEEIK